jgi:hypothetical protein
MASYNALIHLFLKDSGLDSDVDMELGTGTTSPTTGPLHATSSGVGDLSELVTNPDTVQPGVLNQKSPALGNFNFLL